MLPANQPKDRFYAGGAAISAFRGGPPAEPHTPEDWVASTTTVRGEPTAGLTTLPDGTPFAQAVASDPETWLGAEHVQAFGPDTNLLVKLIDAGQRLPVHAHPDDAFAAAHLGSAHGKAEAWYIVSPGEVCLGLTEDIHSEQLRRLVDAQDITPLVEQMHRLSVFAGDTVFVPPGVLHTIGKGILLVEVQQPEDLSIVLEWHGFTLDGEQDGHLGLGFDTALTAVETTARTTESVEALVRRSPLAGPVLASAASPFFRLDLVDVPSAHPLPVGFGVLVVLEGRLTLRAQEGDVVAEAGTTVLIPASAGQIDLLGYGRALHCRPPASGANR
jgi:mannose-6-phosphate isomerase